MKTTHTHKQFFLVALFILFATVSNVCKGQIDCGQKYAIENVLACQVGVTYILTCGSMTYAPVMVTIPSNSTYHVPSCNGGGSCDISVEVNWVQTPFVYPQTGVIVDGSNPTSGYSMNPLNCAQSTGYGQVTWTNYVTQISYY